MAETLVKSHPPNASGALSLRLRGPDGRDRLVRPKASQFAIGADETCALRLRGPAFQPVHCVIEFRAEGAYVRCHADNTLLNGEQFDESPLAPGDRLRVGPVEIEVAGVPAPDSSHATPQTGEQPAVLPDAEPAQSSLAQAGATADELKLLHAMHERLNAIEQQHMALHDEQKSRQAQRQAVDSDLERRAEKLGAQVTALESVVSQCANWDEQARGFSQRFDELEQRFSLLDDAPEQPFDPKPLTAEVGELAQRLEQLSRDWQSTRKSSQDRHRQWVSEREELRAEAKERFDQLELRINEANQGDSSPRHEQWRQDYETRSAELADLAQRADQRLNDLHEQGQTSRAQWESWMAEHGSVKADLQTRVRQLDNGLAELRSELSIANQQRQTMQEAFDESRSQLTARSEEIETCLAELRAEQVAFVEERQTWQAERRRAETNLIMRTEKLDARIAEIDEKLEALPGKRKKERDDHSEVDTRLAELRAEREALEFDRRKDETTDTSSRIEPTARRTAVIPADSNPSSTAVDEDATADVSPDEPEAGAAKTKQRGTKVSREPRAGVSLEPSSAARPAAPTPAEGDSANDQRATASAPDEASRAKSADNPAASAQESHRDEGVQHNSEQVVNEADSSTETVVSEVRTEKVDGLRASEFGLPSEPPSVTVQEALQRLGVGPSGQEPGAESAARPNAASYEGDADAYSSADESIEAYMNRLLGRVQNGEDHTSVQALTSDEAMWRQEPTPPKLSAATPSSLIEEFGPRKTAPERTSNMQAMRELANTNADNALIVHTRSAQRVKQKYRLGVAIGSFGFAIALMGLFSSSGNAAYWVSIGCIVLALISGLQYIVHASQLAAAREEVDDPLESYAQPR